MRCLTFAKKLRATGAQVAFICRELPGNLCNAIGIDRDFVLNRLPSEPNPSEQSRHVTTDGVAHADWLGIGWEEDAVQSSGAILSLCKRADWLVVDHYGLDARWETAMRPMTDHLMVIDDLADRRHDCDVLLDQNLHRSVTDRYDNLIPLFCQQLLGPRYALLRPEFREARAKMRVRDGTVHRLLIFFGGIDASNETSKALEAVKALDRPDIEVDVIVGPSSLNLASIRSMCGGLPHARLHHNPRSIAELIGNADLAIGAAGATSWERCCLGLPSIVISLAMNQESVAHALADNALAIYLGKREEVTAGMITAAVEELLRNPERVKAMGSAGAELADGGGAQRVARALDPHPIALRPAQFSDCESLHRWRNAEDVRRHSHRTDPIPLQQHRQWLSEVLRDPARLLLIGERDHQPIGVLRYDCEESRCAVSIYLVPGHYGYGYGPRLLRAGHEWLQRHRPEIKRVHAEVLAANRASINAFLQAGYRRQASLYIKNLD